ncbi:NAD-dependent epimerase/dehydratase family protein, partial [Candidatus Pelagibacter sp.]|nr:NAD-dependent epimerase/dehydratase family protein [Candidatus Pelagibacter sp.]
MKKKNILVTGGTGFLGRSLVNKLSSEHNVIVFDNDSRGSITKIKNKKNIIPIKGDIRIFKDLLKLKKYKISQIYHLAYINGTGTFYKKPVEILDVAILGIYNVLKFANLFEIKNILLASSSEVYQTPISIPTDTNERLIVPAIENPRYSYGLGKIFTEFYSYHFSKKNNLNIKIFRPHNMFGPDMGNEHVIPQLLKKIFQKKNLNKKLIKLKIQGSGNETRSFCFIDDAVNQILAINKYGKKNNLYNIGQTKEITIKKLIYFISKILKKNIIIEP